MKKLNSSSALVFYQLKHILNQTFFFILFSAQPIDMILPSCLPMNSGALIQLTCNVTSAKYPGFLIPQWSSISWHWGMRLSVFGWDICCKSCPSKLNGI
jgi:hypothetical protein